jgi:hypothetical protein
MPAASPVTEKFEEWFAQYLGQDQTQVQILMDDKRAMHFLIAWSLLESSCFEGYLTEKKLPKFSAELSTSAEFSREHLLALGSYFHNRYQDKRLRENLVHGRDYPAFNNLLTKHFDELSDQELVHFVAFVVYRYRNNIFHGNKGVSSWLQYADQIDRCITVMQILISAAAPKV